MIGEIIHVGKDAYIQVNKQGTLGHLPKIKWYRTLQIWAVNQIRQQSIGEVRDFYNRHKI